MTRLHLTLTALAIAGAGVSAACSKTTPEPEKTEVKASSPTSSTPPSISSAAPAATGATAEAKSDDVAWDAPSAWSSMPNTNTMRKATYKIAKAGGDTEDAELTVSAASGGVDPNIKRWAGQFGTAEPKTEQRIVHGLKVTVVEIKGTYTAGGMMGGSATPKDKYMLLGAIVDTGDRQHFFKMTGPEKTVTSAKKDFDILVSSFRPKSS